ncbi:MAG TPA: hypothetical protein VF017_18355 [Thermoanaerobaculia bacterium]|nr:hypothetical protein [Thermoanaerobaculia bacterium]
MTWLETTTLVMAVLFGAAGAGAQQAAEPTPRIPGLKMADVRDHEHLWREIGELQTWERSDRISIAEYRGKVIEKTAQYLGFEGAAAEQFTAVAKAAIDRVRVSFQAGRRPEVDPGDAHAQLTADLEGAATQVTATFRKEPRHELFAPDCKKWLLRLAFGPSEAKEAKEAEQAGATGAAPASP